ncbi:MAG: hydrogenase expression/formation protein [Burkholderiaceae bacterium]|jgi:hydrogenase-1 operon protein HyaF|nr:hydrogenase expression/formation protein [Burkholderiaceae bacterium]
MNPFPIPVVSIGPGSQSEEVELDYMAMPQGMQTYSMPILPESDDMASLKEAHRVLRQILAALEVSAAGGKADPIDLGQLDVENLRLINQVLGEGEVSARVEGQSSVRIQEAIFAGVWRTVISQDGGVVADHIEVGPVPQMLISAAQNGANVSASENDAPAIKVPAQLPPQVMNAPSIIAELNEQISSWRLGMPAHVVNLTLLPLSPEDVSFLEERLVGGSVLILSRGYGNCRIISTLVPNCWRVTYYNSSDAIILNTLEVIDIPEVACAAREDLQDSCERLAEVLNWVEGA